MSLAASIWAGLAVGDSTRLAAELTPEEQRTLLRAVPLLQRLTES